MTDKVQLIKEEIERRIKDYQSRLAKWSNSEYTGRCQEDKELLKFIDSLPEEPKPKFPHENSIVDKVFGAGNLESFERSEAERLVLLAKEELLKDMIIPEEHNDLEEEIENYIKDSLAVKFPTTNIELIKADIRYIACYFAEWQKQQDEKLFKDDSWNYIEENYPNICQEEKLRLYDISIKSRLAGANAIKQKMVKDAVDATILDINAQTIEFGLWPEKLLDIKEGDKVKIIVIKEN